MQRGTPVGWKKIGFALYHAFPHPVYPWDAKLVERFRREVDPTFVPLWVRNVYRHPCGSEHIFDRHVLAISVCDNNSVISIQHDFRRGILGADRRYRPHTILDILEGPPHTAIEPGLPGAFKEFGPDDLQKWKEKAWWGQQFSKEEDSAYYLEQERQKIQAIDDKWRAESDYRWDHDWRYMNRLHQQMTMEEQKAALAQDAWARRRVYH